MTYAFGNDLFDESFSIETEDGEFLGECGFAITETLAAAGTAVTALTPRKGHVGKPQTEPGTRERNGQRGELIVARPRAKVLLETATLQVQATVVERKYGVDRTAPKDSYFETVTLNIKCLQREL